MGTSATMLSRYPCPIIRWFTTCASGCSQPNLGHATRARSLRAQPRPSRIRKHCLKPSVLEETRQIVSGKLRHFKAAQGISRHPLVDVAVSVPPDLHAAANCISREQQGIGAWRAVQLGRLQRSERIVALAPTHVRWAVGPHGHPALMMVYIDALDWPDKHFAYRQYVEGWPVVGWPTGAGLYRHCPAKDMARDSKNYVHPDRLKRTNGDSSAILAASILSTSVI